MSSKSSTDASLTTTPHSSNILPENNKPSWWGARSQGIWAMPLIWKYLFFLGFLNISPFERCSNFGIQLGVPISLSSKSAWIFHSSLFFLLKKKKKRKKERKGQGCCQVEVYIQFHSPLNSINVKNSVQRDYFFLKLQYLFILVKFSGSEDPWQFNNIGWLFWYTVLGSKRLKPEHPRLRETSLNSKIKF